MYYFAKQIRTNDKSILYNTFHPYANANVHGQLTLCIHTCFPFYFPEIFIV